MFIRHVVIYGYSLSHLGTNQKLCFNVSVGFLFRSVSCVGGCRYGAPRSDEVVGRKHGSEGRKHSQVLLWPVVALWLHEAYPVLRNMSIRFVQKFDVCLAKPKKQNSLIFLRRIVHRTKKISLCFSFLHKKYQLFLISSFLKSWLSPDEVEA